MSIDFLVGRGISRYLELEHQNTLESSSITRVYIKRDDRGLPFYEDSMGRGINVLQLEQLLRSDALVDLRIHDGQHVPGPCYFSFRGFLTIGRYV